MKLVMPGLVPGIHVLLSAKDVDGRDKPGHDGASVVANQSPHHQRHAPDGLAIDQQPHRLRVIFQRQPV